MAKKVLRFVVGERAVIQGMDDVLMNGKRCTIVCDFMKDQGRYGVELCDGVRCKIKPTNLSLVTDEDTDKRKTLISSLAELENPTKKLRGLEFNRYISPIYNEHQTKAKENSQNFDDCIMMMHAVMEHFEKVLPHLQEETQATTVLYWSLECMELDRIPRKIPKDDRVKMGKIIDAVYKIESNKNIEIMKIELEILTREETERQLDDISTFANEINGGVACGSILRVEHIAESEFRITDNRPGIDVDDDGNKERTALKSEDDDGDKDSKPKATTHNTTQKAGISTDDGDESDQEEDAWRRTGTCAHEEMLTYIHKFMIAPLIIESMKGYEEAHENNSD